MERERTKWGTRGKEDDKKGVGGRGSEGQGRIQDLLMYRSYKDATAKTEPSLAGSGLDRRAGNGSMGPGSMGQMGYFWMGHMGHWSLHGDSWPIIIQ